MFENSASAATSVPKRGVPRPRWCALLVAAVCAGILTGRSDAGQSLDSQDLVFLDGHAPIFIRIHVRVDGKSYHEAWVAYVDQFFADLDADGDGTLGKVEARRIPSRQQLAQMGFGARRQVKRPSKDVSPQQLRDYLDQATGGSFTVSTSKAGPPTNRVVLVRGVALNQGGGETGLFEKLDADGDRRLSPAELDLTARVRKLDLDDDMTISPAELRPTQGGPYAVTRSASRTRVADTSPFHRVGPERSSTRAVALAIQRYDDGAGGGTANDRKLSREEFPIGHERFSRCDSNQDGLLDSVELRRLFLSPPPDLEVTIRLGSRQDSSPVTEAAIRPGTLDPGSLSTAADVATLVLGKVRIDIGTQPENRRVRLSPTENLTRQFTSADTDKNGYLDQQESRRYAPFRTIFAAMDRDGDGKVFKEEMLAFTKQMSAASRSRTHLTITDQGHKLFEILDASEDGRLNRRELQQGRQKIAGWDENEDQQLAKSEIPRSWRLTLARGNSSGIIAFRTVTTYLGRRPARRSRSAGPGWFLKMDRNNDGELTRREFVGSAEQFRAIDPDGDGVVTAAEAEIAR